jgi:hypothetical protein
MAPPVQHVCCMMTCSQRSSPGPHANCTTYNCCAYVTLSAAPLQVVADAADAAAVHVGDCGGGGHEGKCGQATARSVCCQHAVHIVVSHCLSARMTSVLQSASTAEAWAIRSCFGGMLSGAATLLLIRECGDRGSYAVTRLCASVYTLRNACTQRAKGCLAALSSALPYWTRCR